MTVVFARKENAPLLPIFCVRRDISFVFRTESGVAAPGGFQCRLVDEEAVDDESKVRDEIG
jgi:hypothetical protein